MPLTGKPFGFQHPTPLIADVLFQEVVDVSQSRWRDKHYGTPHWDPDRYPHHELVHRQPAPDRGDHHELWFYAARRENQDRYNFEHEQADLGTVKYSTVTRSYLIKREDYSATSPALGSAMPDVPASKFSASNYALVQRKQHRVSERAIRGQSTIGTAELDSLYVVETRVYIDREQLTEHLGFDDATNGNLYRTHDIYIRGENYSNALNGSAVPIETAAAADSYWGVTSAGQQISFTQMSDDVWVVHGQDLISQSLTTTGNIWGGKVVRVFETSASYPWPAVLGSDGVPEATGNLGVEIMDWAYKTGSSSRNYVRPRYKRSARSLRSRAEIHREWLTPAQLAAVDGEGGSLDIIDNLDTKPIYYPSPYTRVNLPPSLHNQTILQCDTGTGDPTWGLNVGSTRTYPATAQLDWPDFVIADVQVQEWRGGYLVSRVKIFAPRDP